MFELCYVDVSSSIFVHLSLSLSQSTLLDNIVNFDVNGTVHLLTTNTTGYISLPIELQPVDEQSTTYQITATFNGTSPQTLNATAKNPYGTEYPVCTTIQYQLRPMSNATSFTAGPTATDVYGGNKTPEEVQADVEQQGWLSIWHEFTWWYPWYRLHLNMTGADPPIDLIISPLALDVTIEIYDESAFAGLMGDVFDGTYDFAWGIMIGHIATAIATRMAGRMSWVALAIACVLNAAVQLTLAALANKAWQDSRTWFISFFASLASAAGFGLYRVLQGKMMQWLTGIARRICGKITHTFKSWFARGLKFSLITDIAFIFIDVVLAVTFYGLYAGGVIW